MTTPIASPQNLYAVSVINDRTWNATHGNYGPESQTINWGPWLAVSIPYSVVCTLVSFGFLWMWYRPKILEVNPVPKRTVEPMSFTHVIVIVVCFTTIVLWALNTQIAKWIGSPGIVALFPVIVFFTLPILEKQDFKNLAWDVLMLLAGGIALGDGIKSSGLLELMATGLADLVKHSDQWVVALAFSCFIWLFGNFISHTVAAIIVLPVIATVGCQLGMGDCEKGNFAMLVIVSVFIDSGAMGLPVASFPNAQCYSLKDKRGNQYLTTMDFVKTGFLIGLLEICLLMLIAYNLLVVLT